MALVNYFDFAENDYKYFIQSVERGDVANIMGALAQGICEKYMKHLIVTYYKPCSPEEYSLHENILRTHSLGKLVRFLRENMKIPFSDETRKKMAMIDGYYFSTRYPGEDSIEISELEIKDCADAVQSCRAEVLMMLDKNLNL